MSQWQEFTDAVMTREELFNILKALRLTGGCDDRTLGIVAQAVGLPWPPDGVRAEVIEAYLLENKQ
jgi:hypothetical protein